MRLDRLAPLLLLAGLAGCPPADDKTGDSDDTDGSGDTSDTGTDDTADTGTDDTADTSTGDTDDTDVLGDNCALATPPSGLTTATAPTIGENIKFTRTIQACANSAGATALYWVEILDSSNNLLCRYASTFTSTSSDSTAGCTDCDGVYTGTWSTPIYTGWDCDHFGQANKAPYYVDDLSAEQAMSPIATTTSPDLMYDNTDDGWTQIDTTVNAPPDLVVTRTDDDSFDDARFVETKTVWTYAY